MIYYKLNLTHELISNSSQCYIYTDKYMKLESVIILHWIHSNYPKEICPKGNQSWIFIGRTDAKAETPILWPPDAKKWLTGKDSDAGKYWRQEEKGKTEDDMVGWHHWLNANEFEQMSWWCTGKSGVLKSKGCKESDTTKQLNWTDSNYRMKLTRCSLKADHHTVFTSMSSQHSTKLVQN